MDRLQMKPFRFCRWPLLRIALTVCCVSLVDLSARAITICSKIAIRVTWAWRHDERNERGVVTVTITWATVQQKNQRMTRIEVNP